MTTTRVIKGNWKIIANLILYYVLLMILTIVPILLSGFKEHAGIVFWGEFALAAIAIGIKALSEFNPEYHAKFKWFWQKFGGLISLAIVKIFAYIEMKKKK